MTGLVDASLQSVAALLDALPDAIAILDGDGNVIRANQAAGRLIGYQADALTGIAIDEVLPARYPRAPAIGRRLQALAGRQAGRLGSRLELHLVHHDGHEIPVDVTVTLAEIDSRPVAMLTVREIADVERTEAVRRLAAVVQSSADAILTKDLDGIITSWNRGAERMYGYTAEEIIGQSVSVLMRPQGVDELSAIMEQVRRGQPIDNLETLRVDRDGRPLDVSISISPLRDGRGTVVGAATVARDISERKRADQRLRALLESAPDAVVVVGERGQMVLVNRQTEELFGYGREELLGRDVEMLIPERLREVEAHRVGNFASPETRLTGAAMELSGLRADGREFPIELTFSPLHSDEGLLVYTAIRDITERKLIEEELRRSNHDLEQFAYVASHDLSEPLRVIAGFVDLLAQRYRGALDKDADRFIDFIVSGVERMQALIDDLLAYSRAGRASFLPRPVEVGEVVQDVVWALEPEMSETGGRIEVGEMPTVRAEKALLRQIFQNLIGNAVKFSDAAAPRVEVRAKRYATGWRFDVQDNGPGIEPRYAERVFEMFQRLHGREVAGSGMGLAIVKRLTERHGGQVWVTPAQPRGSIFSFTIPDSGRE